MKRKQIVIVGLVFFIAVTPTFVDYLWVKDNKPEYKKLVKLWYVGLFLFAWFAWKQL